MRIVVSMELANELCQCDEYQKVIDKFKPYHFHTVTPYSKSMYRMDGTPCDLDEFSYNRLYKKKFRWADKGCFDDGTTVKMPQHTVQWRMRPVDINENRLYRPKAETIGGSVSKGILPPDLKTPNQLKHERILLYYKPAKPEHLNVVYN